MAPTVRDRLVREALLDGSPGTQTIRGVCPFCVRRGHHTKKKNLSLDRSTGRFFCFKCHTTDLLDGWEITEEYLLKKPPPEIPTFDPPPGWVRIGPAGTPTTLQARNYLLGRGIASRAIQEAKMGVSTEAPESREDLDFRNRAIVPILAADEETWLGYVGRDLRKKSTMPYLYCRGMMRGKILYNQKEVFRETDVTPAGRGGDAGHGVPVAGLRGGVGDLGSGPGGASERSEAPCSSRSGRGRLEKGGGPGVDPETVWCAIRPCENAAWERSRRSGSCMAPGGGPSMSSLNRIGWVQDGKRYDGSLPHPIVNGHLLVLGIIVTEAGSIFGFAIVCVRCGLEARDPDFADLRLNYGEACGG